MQLLPFCILLSIVHSISFVAPFSPLVPSRQAKRYLAAGTDQSTASIEPPSNPDIHYLGKGADAIVRPGVILIPPSFEFSTYLRECALFIHAMGYDERLETNVVRGVVIDYPTAFHVGEMAGIEGKLADNIIYRGGSEGGDSVMMLHSFGGAGREEIGTSGIYEGGLAEAIEACENGTANPSLFKFFFNYCQFGTQELEDIIEVEEDDDAWVSVQVPPEMVLRDWEDRSACWKQLRNAVRQYT